MGVHVKRWLALVSLCLAVLGLNASVAAPAHAIVHTYSYFEFDKGTAPVGELHFWVYNVATDALILHRTWPAGSGTGSADECYTNNGWLPNGTYSVKAWHKTNGVILGDIFELSDKKCPSRTLRTDLFIHTEQTASSGQCTNTSGVDDTCYWGDSSNEYRSNGCIKLSPTDLHSAYATFLMYNSANTWYGGKLTVHD